MGKKTGRISHVGLLLDADVLVCKLTLARERPTFSFYSLLSFLLDKSESDGNRTPDKIRQEFTEKFGIVGDNYILECAGNAFLNMGSDYQEERTAESMIRTRNGIIEIDAGNLPIILPLHLTPIMKRIKNQVGDIIRAESKETVILSAGLYLVERCRPDELYALLHDRDIQTGTYDAANIDKKKLEIYDDAVTLQRCEEHLRLKREEVNQGESR